MSAGISQNYYNSIVKIYKVGWSNYADNQINYAGGGVIVDDTTIITCAHVVANALNYDSDAKVESLPKKVILPVKRLFVDGYESEPVNVILIEYNGREKGKRTSDIAALKLESGKFDLETDKSIPKFKIISEATDQKVTSLGFPEDSLLTIEQSVSALYKIQEITQLGWLSIISSETIGQIIRPGFSGAPVMEKSSGNIVGIVCEAYPNSRTANVISAKYLNQVYPLDLVPKIIAEEEINYSTDVSLQLTRPGFRLFGDYIWPKLHYFLTVKLSILADPPERADIRSLLRQNMANWIDELKDKTYIPLPAKTMEDSTVQLQGSGDNFLLPIQQLIKSIAGISSGGDASNAQISALSKRSKRVRNLVRVLLKSDKPIIILGEPGSGKSITLKQVAIELCRLNENKIFPSICIFISLGRWTPVSDPQISHVEKLVEDQLPSHFKPLFRELIIQNRLIVIFDGMDEMSREGYVQHTEALSKYADKYTGQIRTLFSCRISDFSPAFRHHRMVIMPFERSHIRNYLLRVFGNNKINISDETVSVSELSKKLLTTDLPILPQNPFSLWLLCLYIRENRSWPESRAELLRFSFEYQINAKKAALINPQLSVDDMFNSWGKLAFEITLRNKGTDIGLHEIRGLFGSATNGIIKTGVVCGILQQTTNHDPELVRFSHQRAQEFFTAHHLVNNEVKLNFGTYIDIPRWQEAIIFMTQMPGGVAPVEELKDSLEIGPEYFQQTSSSDKKFENVLIESVIAERVEFGSRIAKVIQKDTAGLAFLETLKTSVVWLAKNGMPISQVKMLQVVQAIPQLDIYEIVSFLRGSKINWVRENAEIVAANLSGSLFSGGIPDDTIAAFADGSIFNKLPSRLRVANKVKSRKGLILNISVALLLGFQYIAMGGLIPLLSKLLIDSLQLRPEIMIYAHWVPWALTGIAFLATSYSVIFEPEHTWFYAITSGVIFFVLIVAVPLIWVIAKDINVGLLIIGVVAVGRILAYGWGVFLLLITAIGITIGFVFTGILSFIMFLWTKDKTYFISTFKIAWRQESYSDFLEEDAQESIGNAVLILLAAAVFALLAKFGVLDFFKNSFAGVHSIIPELPYSYFFFDILVTLLLVVTSMVIIYSSVHYVFKRNAVYTIKLYKNSLYLLAAAVGIYLLSILYHLLGFVFGLIYRKIGDYPAFDLVRILVFILIIAIFIAVLVMVYHIANRFLQKINLPFLLPSSESEFRSAIKTSRPNKQAYLLKNVDPQRLNLQIDSYLKVLIEIEKDIVEEPATSQYHSKMSEIIELLRQSRVG